MCFDQNSFVFYPKVPIHLFFFFSPEKVVGVTTFQGDLMIYLLIKLDKPYNIMIT
jgi:hypothetical protein